MINKSWFILTFVFLFHFLVQESPGEGIKWSIMSLHGIDYKDAGNYSCKAKNVAGTAEAAISISVAGTASTTSPPLRPGGGTVPTAQFMTLTPPIRSSNSPFMMTTVFPRLSTTLSAVQRQLSSFSGNELLKGSLKQIKNQQGSNGKKLAADEKSKKNYASRPIKDLRIIEETADSAVLLWTVGGLLNDASLTVVYSPYGDDDTKRTMETRAGSGKVLLDGLSPGMRYSVCLVAKGSPAGKDPCIDFYTEDGEQNQLLVIISGIACALVLPLIALLIYKILALYCKGKNTASNEDELQKESYVKFETISMKPRTTNSHPAELWARRPTNESERLLLCSRSSIDSQMTYKSDGSRSEYLC